MTVRTWLTISAAVLVALAIATAVKILSPLPAPAIFATASATRLEGVLRGSCWAQRSGEPRCERASTDPLPPARSVKPSGTLRVVAAYPVQPKDGTLRIVQGSRTVLRSAWTDELRYDLPPGSYVLRANAQYSTDSYVRYEFAFRIR